MISAIFDDHFEAFPVWREAGLRDLVCVHVDAHLDVMKSGFNDQSLKGIAEATSRDELMAYRGNPRLPWGGFHCGNYLYPALVDGTVKELIWVVPPHIIAGETFVDGVRQETQNWLDLKFSEYGSLKSEDGAVTGEVEGCRFVVCTADKLPELAGENLVLDIDVDYFIDNRDDSIWQTPKELFEQMSLPSPKALTIAYSVDGGYTPLQERFLGEITKAVFEQQDASQWDQELKDLMAVDKLESEERIAALEEFLEKAPEWMKPAVLLRLGRGEEAAGLNAEYTLRHQNIVARHLIKKEHDEGLEALAEIGEETPESIYLRAYLHLGKGDSLEAKRSLSKLLERSDLKELERSRVLLLKANACLDLGEAKQAVALISEMVKLEPKSSEAHYVLANAHKVAGDLKKAAKMIRKALRLAKGRVSSLPMLLDAARIYDTLGQVALAKSTRKELRAADVTGRYAIKTMLDESKL